MITENKTNYYDILEVSTSATQHDILLAYQKAMLTYSGNNMAIRSAFSESELAELKKIVEEAFLVLSNQNYRNIYEQRLNAKTYSDSDITFNAIKSSTEVTDQANAVEKLIQKHAQLQAQKAKPVQVDEQFEEDAEFEVEIKNCEEWTGEFLKKVREYKKISIDTLQESTKINPWYIRSIEIMDFKNLPATVFVRGYVIQLAKELGLNEKVVADSYMKIYKEKLEHAK